MDDQNKKGYLALTIASEYRSFRTNIVRDFFIPILSETKVYRRAVGFFSSSSLLEISEGITGLVKNEGKIQLISSPYLSEDDVLAMNTGYSERDRIRNILLSHLLEPFNYFEEQRLNLLAHLIKNGVLDIRIAFTKNLSGFGLYHEKMGIVNDYAENIIAFSGSLNESQTAFKVNYEAIDVFCSWKNQDQLSRVNLKLSAFNSIWENNEPNMVTMEFPEVKEEIIKKYLKAKPNLDIDFEEFGNITKNVFSRAVEENKSRIKIPDKVLLYDYQIDAINEWQKHNFSGIFDMATGTGKTFTALGGIVNLYEHTNGKLAVIIVCPFQHLVEQWAEDAIKFGIAPIIGYSRSSQRDWKTNLTRSIRDQRLGVKGKEFFCFLTTNATFGSQFVQEQMNKIKGDALLVVDEAHNFGAESLKTKLPDNFKFRLALSATLERHRDEDGTNALYDYFGEKCITYTLERAISEKKLTGYYYYPVLVTLSSNELALYKQLSRELAKCIFKSKTGKIKLNQKGKQIAIKRSRVIAGAKNKTIVLKDLMEAYKNESHILVYCGAASILIEGEDETPVDKDDLRQIEQVTDLIGNELNMLISQFTSKEDIEERKILKEQFEKGETLQALIAIKCLDEGVNIPKIKTAFILASTTNPKEYVQRRGRVLRLAEGKDYSTIFDLITIPYEPYQVASLTKSEIELFQTLVRNELNRGYEFANLSLNSFEAKKVLIQLEEAYGITDIYFSDFGGENARD